MCKKKDQAEQTALYLEKKQWGDYLQADDEFQLGYLLQPNNEGYYVHNEDIFHKFNLGRITAKEVKEAIKTMANNKAGGTDGTTIEILKCLDEDNLEEIAEVLNIYWAEEKVPDELTHARVVSLYKKGNPRLQSNYRPISLLNTTYKIYVKIIKTRLANVIDEHITSTQYGFRAKRSTSQAIHVVRRVGEFAEMGGSEMHMALLDWEKAFDR
eukprot:11040260-Karenia_brevis.AAC.1